METVINVETVVSIRDTPVAQIETAVLFRFSFLLQLRWLSTQMVAEKI